MTLTDFYKAARKAQQPRPIVQEQQFTGPMAGATVGGSMSAAARHMLAKRPWAKGLKGWGATSLAGTIGPLAGIYLGSKLGRNKEKKAQLIPTPPKTNVKIDLTPKFKGAVPQAKDAGKKLIKVQNNIPKL
jgi:hypothetical protein